MKVLQINTFDRGGGAEQFAFDLTLSKEESYLLVKQKYSNSDKVIGLKKFFLDHLFILFDKVLFKLGIRQNIKQKLFISEQLNNTYKKLSLTKEYKEADIIHLHNIHGGYFDLHALRDIANEKPVIWTLHDMWLMTGGEAYIFDFNGYQHGDAKSPYKQVAPLNDPLIDRRQQYLEKKKKLMSELGSHLTLVLVSDWLADCLKRSYVFNERNNIVTIKNGVNTDIFYNKGIRNWNKPRILFFNSKNKFKGCRLFLSILDKIKYDCEVLVVGQAITTPSSSMVRIKHFKHIYDRAQLNELYNSVDILIFPSEAENFPLTLLEAIAAGVYIVASDVGGIPEIVQNKKAGTLFEKGNATDLLFKINEALLNIKFIRANCKERSDDIQNCFSWKKMLAEYDKLYYKVLDDYQ